MLTGAAAARLATADHFGPARQIPRAYSTRLTFG